MLALYQVVVLFQKFVDTPVNERPYLFRINSGHQIETSLFHALLVYYYYVYGTVYIQDMNSATLRYSHSVLISLLSGNSGIGI
jgi:hypothetical protein